MVSLDLASNSTKLKNRLSLNKLEPVKRNKIRTWWRFWASGFDDKKFEEDLDLLSTFIKMLVTKMFQ